LDAAVEVRKRVIAGQHEGAPQQIEGDEAAMAYFGVIHQVLEQLNRNIDVEVSADAATAMREILARNDKVRFWDDPDAQNRARNEMDDYLYDVVRDGRGVELGVEHHDEIIDKVMRVARSRAAR
jgi:type I restriction enzyme R subunit